MSWPRNNSLLAVAGRFSIVGAINTGLGFVVIFILMAAGLNPFTSNAIGYVVGLSTSFFLHRGWVFSHHGRTMPQVVKYAISVLIAYVGNIFTLSVLLKMDLWAYLAQLTAAATYTAILFFLSAQWVFRRDAESR